MIIMITNMEKLRMMFMGLVFGLILLQSSVALSNNTPLNVGFYRQTCPSAEAIVKSTVDKAYAADTGAPAALVRLLFHDCFVRGCDASILLDSTPNIKAEKDSTGNLGIGGFDVIDKAKALIEAQCPNTVSCADIIAFAARDGVYKAGGLHYEVPGGRRDGRVSLIDEVTKNLPDSFLDAAQLKENFARKGLSMEEMVTLSGAHTIGDAHCSNFAKRLYSFNSTYSQDPALNAAYAKYLRTQCPRSSTSATSNPNPIVHLDTTTPIKFDNTYYHNLMSHKGLLFTDQVLYSSDLTRPLVWGFANHPAVWSRKFVAAMLHMGSIEVLTGKEGEIRKNCRVVN